MSWSISFIGTSEKVAEALTAYSEKIDGYSKVEYDKALPHMVALVKENFGNAGELVKCSASGHGYIVNDVPQQGHLNCEITSIYGVLV